jgi:hypothetical protein
MLIWWGPEFCQLYSDAFLALAEDCQLQAEARAIGRRISAEKPGDFVRRCAFYWETWTREDSDREAA